MNRVIEKMDMTCDMEDEELQELIHEVLEEASKEEFIPLQERYGSAKSCLMRSGNWIFCRS